MMTIKLLLYKIIIFCYHGYVSVLKWFVHESQKACELSSINQMLDVVFFKCYNARS